MPSFTNNLLSLGKLCDAGCYAHLNQYAIHVYNDTHDLVLRADRETTGARLWRVDLRPGPLPSPHPNLPHLHATCRQTAALAKPGHGPTPAPYHTAPAPAMIEADDDEDTSPLPPPVGPGSQVLPPTPRVAVPAPTPATPTVEHPPGHPQLPRLTGPPRGPPKPTPTTSHPLLPIAGSLTTSPPRPRAANTLTHRRAYDLPSTRALIEYLHATAGSPVRSTWLYAIKRGYFHSWPGLTYANASKDCPISTKTIKGHFTQTRKGLQPTKPKPTTVPPPPLLPLMNFMSQ